MNEQEKLIAHQREEIRKLHEQIHNLEQSRDFWMKKATKLAKKLNDLRKGGDRK